MPAASTWLVRRGAAAKLLAGSPYALARCVPLANASPNYDQCRPYRYCWLRLLGEAQGDPLLRARFRETGESTFRREVERRLARQAPQAHVAPSSLVRDGLLDGCSLKTTRDQAGVYSSKMLTVLPCVVVSPSRAVSGTDRKMSSLRDRRKLCRKTHRGAPSIPRSHARAESRFSPLPSGHEHG